MNKHLACITCFFNFYNCPLQERNLHRFIEHITSFDVPVYGVELVLPGQIPVTGKYNTWRQIAGTSDNILWQKEVLLNLAEKMVPDKFDTIAWVDADVKFQNKNWIEDLTAQLAFCDFAQLFDRACWLDENNIITHTLPTVINYNPLVWVGHPGFAWGCTRHAWHSIGGLYERCISGGGDRIIAASLTGKLGAIHRNINNYIGGNERYFYEWYRNITNNNIIVSHIPGDVLHEFHGVMEKRQYKTRKIHTPKIDAYRDIIKDKNFLLAWSEDVSEEIRQHFKDYFLNRKT